NGAPGGTGFDVRRAQPLHAVRTFLHHAAASHRDIGVPAKLQAFRCVVRKLQEVEAAHLVRAIVGTVARADAAVVDHVVETIGAMDRGYDGAHQLTGSVFALHTGDGLDKGPRAVDIVSGKVTVDPEPVHLVASYHFRFADHGNIVLGLTGNDTRTAPGAGRQVNGHAPAIVRGGRHRRIHGQRPQLAFSRRLRPCGQRLTGN